MNRGLNILTGLFLMVFILGSVSAVWWNPGTWFSRGITGNFILDESDVIANYDFEKGVVDASGNGNLLGNSKVYFRSTATGKDARFNGNDSYLYSSSPDFEMGEDDFEISFMAKNVKLELNDVIIGKGNENSKTEGYRILGNVDIGYYLRVHDGANTVRSEGIKVEDKEWHEFRYVFEREKSDGIRAYLDGVEVGSGKDTTKITGRIDASNSRFVIGKNSEGKGGYISGLLDDVVVRKGGSGGVMSNESNVTICGVGKSLCSDGVCRVECGSGVACGNGVCDVGEDEEICGTDCGGGVCGVGLSLCSDGVCRVDCGSGEGESIDNILLAYNYCFNDYDMRDCTGNREAASGRGINYIHGINWDSYKGVAVEFGSDSQDSIFLGKFGGETEVSSGIWFILKDFDWQENHFILSKGDSEIGPGYDIRGNSEGGLIFNINDGINKKSLTFIPNSDFDKNEWNYFGFTWEHGAIGIMKIYFDGDVVNSTPLIDFGKIVNDNFVAVGCVDTDGIANCNNGEATSMKLDELSFHFSVPSNGEDEVENDLSAQYDFDKIQTPRDLLGNIVNDFLYVEDISGYGNFGIVDGVSLIDGKAGSSFEFGLDSQDSISFENTFNIGDENLKISFWLKDYDWTLNHFILSKGDAYQSAGYDIRGCNNGMIIFRINDGVNSSYVSFKPGVKFNKNEWNKFEWVVDRKKGMDLYVNDELVDSQSISNIGLISNSNSFMIGCVDWRGNNICDNVNSITSMKLDELKIYGGVARERVFSKFKNSSVISGTKFYEFAVDDYQQFGPVMVKLKELVPLRFGNAKYVVLEVNGKRKIFYRNQEKIIDGLKIKPTFVGFVFAGVEITPVSDIIVSSVYQIDYSSLIGDEKYSEIFGKQIEWLVNDYSNSNGNWKGDMQNDASAFGPRLFFKIYQETGNEDVYDYSMQMIKYQMGLINKVIDGTQPIDMDFVGGFYSLLSCMEYSKFAHEREACRMASRVGLAVIDVALLTDAQDLFSTQSKSVHYDNLASSKSMSIQGGFINDDAESFVFSFSAWASLEYYRLTGESVFLTRAKNLIKKNEKEKFNKDTGLFEGDYGGWEQSSPLMAYSFAYSTTNDKSYLEKADALIEVLNTRYKFLEKNGAFDTNEDFSVMGLSTHMQYIYAFNELYIATGDVKYKQLSKEFLDFAVENLYLYEEYPRGVRDDWFDGKKRRVPFFSHDIHYSPDGMERFVSDNYCTGCNLFMLNNIYEYDRLDEE